MAMSEIFERYEAEAEADIDRSEPYAEEPMPEPEPAPETLSEIEPSQPPAVIDASPRKPEVQIVEARAMVDVAAAMWKFALRTGQSALCPAWAKAEKGEQRTATIWSVMMMGREHGLNPIQSLAHILPINGRITVSVQLQRALMEEAGAKLNDPIIERDESGQAVSATITDDQGHSASFSIADADAAGLTRQDPNKKPGAWTTYREDMLVARATARFARRHYASAILGMDYVHGELDG